MDGDSQIIILGVYKGKVRSVEGRYALRDRSGAWWHLFAYGCT